MGRRRTRQDSASGAVSDRDDIREIIREELSKMKNELRAEVTEVIRETLKSELADLRSKITAQQEQITQLQKALVNSEHDRLIEQRKSLSCNLILSGLPEATDEDNDLTKIKTSALLNKVVDNAVIVSAVRVGQKHDGRPRKIKIVTKSQDERTI